MLRPLSRFLVRAPLLPLSSLRRPVREVFGNPMMAQALAHLPPSAERARENYARRAAFRPTPHGLWAGVLVGELGARARVATGVPRAHVTLSYAQRWQRARATLEEANARDASRLRVAPSLVADDRQASWLAFGEDGAAEAVVRAAEMDEPLLRVIDAAQNWAPWPRLREIAGVDDEWLLRLLDDGLLVSSEEPPLIGPRAAAGCGGHAGGAHVVDGAVTLPRAAVERAARLAPLLHRLQAALSPPVAERELTATGAIDVATELFGAGALDLAALMRGDYGVLFDGENGAARSIAPLPPRALGAAGGADRAKTTPPSLRPSWTRSHRRASRRPPASCSCRQTRTRAAAAGWWGCTRPPAPAGVALPTRSASRCSTRWPSWPKRSGARGRARSSSTWRSRPRASWPIWRRICLCAAPRWR